MALSTSLPNITAPAISRAARPTTVWRTGAVAGVAAAAVTLAFAATVEALGVSFADDRGRQIPLLGFAQVTLFCAAIGIAMAAFCARRLSRPKRSFLVTTISLTIASLVPPLLIHADASTVAALIVVHAIAAAVIIPPLAGRLDERR